MRFTSRATGLVGSVLLSVLVFGMVVPAGAAPVVEQERVIVTFRAGASADAVSGRAERSGAQSVKSLPSAHAAVLRVTPAQRKALASDPGVLMVESDVRYTVAARPAAAKSTQVLPWGIDRVDAELAWATTRASGVRVAVIDTGIDTAHPDLVANIAGGYNAISPTASYKDDNGHGTHVAGTIGAVDNSVGVIGVGPRASLLGVKVLDSTGSGWTSDIVEGMDWAVANGARVINMSLSGPSYISVFQAAVDRANAAGVVVVAAAGNTGPADSTVGFPAAYNGVIAVSATDSYSNVASFSSRGPQVDIAAPGVAIRSTYWTLRGRSGYAELNGTSMASPHVAGAAALVLGTPASAWDADLDGTWDPVEVETKLKATARDLGVVGSDSLYGAGLVDAAAAVRP